VAKIKDFNLLMDRWPESWQCTGRDIPAGEALVVQIKPFVEYLQRSGLTRKTVKRHLDNLWAIGGEIVRSINEEPEKRKRPPREVLFEAIEIGEAPLCRDASEAEQRSLDATARKLKKFMEGKPAPAAAKRKRLVYQFKVTLEAIEPPVWRRIQVPGDYTFWDLHVAIQDAMGWKDCHLHEFFLPSPEGGGRLSIGIPHDDGFGGKPPLAGWKAKLSGHLSPERNRAVYVYDFGDDWVHELELEDVLPREKRGGYPRCLAGERACPPEDCGGPPGYKELVEAMADPGQERYQELTEWLGGPFDPERFAAAEIVFDDPRQRRRAAFEGE